MIRISILGASGRMGRRLISAVLESSGFELGGALVRHGSEYLGQDAGLMVGAGACGVSCSDDLATVLAGADVAIDFTLPEATVFNVSGCETAGCALVIGSTGHSEEQQLSLRERRWQVPAVLAPNMSIGVNVLYRLAEMAAAALPDFDAEIAETHHKRKQDAPSGTALMLAEVIAGARAQNARDVIRTGRGPDQTPRQSEEIGISALRAGEIVGEHTVLLAGPGETLEIRHRALDRGNFAHGALQAAAWVSGRPAGLYDMGDVVGFKAPSGRSK